ncbi:YfhO family protein [Desulfotomaculum sp. 1211_IL3151]|uniref:YfhO family protein n=1 Tax=Desulfotomaculum sp. 1211_IL3151 TaxID=3084055 RepID=UPI002FD9871A
MNRQISTLETPCWKKRITIVFSVMGFYTLLFVLFFSPAFLSGKLLAPGDGIIQYVAAFYWGLDLWNPYLLSGVPQFADPQAMMWYPPRIIFQNLSWNAFVLFAYVVAGSCTFGYAYKLTRNIYASLMAGVIYSMSGFFMAHLGHATIIHGAAWFPLILWGLEELREKYTAKWFVITACAVALCTLAGHPQITTYVMGLAGLYVITMAWDSKGRLHWKYLMLSGAIVIIGILLAFIQLLPSAEFASLSMRSKMDYPTFVTYALPALQSLMLFFPFLFGGLPNELNIYPYYGVSNMTELSGYLGWLPYFLTGAYLLSGAKRSRLLIFWLVVAIVSGLLTLGDATPLAKIMFQIPGYNLFRAPARHLIELTMALSILAALGLKTLMEIQPSRSFTKRVAYLGTAFVIFILGLVIIKQGKIASVANEQGITSFSLAPWENVSITIQLIMALISLIILVWYSKLTRKKAAAVVMILLLIIDLGSFGWFYEWKYWSPPAKVLELNKGLIEPGYQRVAPLEGYGTGVLEVKPNISQTVATYNMSGYGPLVLNKYHELTGVWPDGSFNDNVLKKNNRVLDILAVKHLYAYDPTLAKTNELWAPQELGVVLNHENNANSFVIPNLAVNRLSMVGSLANSLAVQDKEPVAEVEILFADNSKQTLQILAGRDLSEWAYDRQDVKAAIKHSRAQIFQSFSATDDAGGSFQGHQYLCQLDLNETKTIKGINLKRVATSDVKLDMFRLSLSNTIEGQNWPVTMGNSELADGTRWHLVQKIGDINVYENHHAMPMAWIVGEINEIPKDSLLVALKTGNLPDGSTYNPATMALVEPGSHIPATESHPGIKSSVEIIQANKDAIKLKANLTKPGLLVVSNIYYPGWQAYVNGKKTSVYEVNYALQGIHLPAGNQSVEFKFAPKSFTYGKYITIGAASILALVVLVPLFRRNNR